jgi:tetratricopeptide (TPR) repeat protein
LTYLLKFAIEAHGSAGNLHDAEKAYRRAVELLQQLIDNRFAPDPYPAGHQGGFLLAQLGQAQEAWAFALARGGRLDEAKQLFRDVASTSEKAQREFPGLADHWHSLANAHRNIGSVALQQSQLAEAEREFRLAIDIHSQRAEKFPDQPVRAWEWGACYFEFGRFLAQIERFDEAAAAYRRGLELHSEDHRYWNEAASIYLASGEEESYRRACREILDRFAKGASDQPEVAAQMARTCSLLPDAVEGFEHVEKLAERAVTGTEKEKHYRSFVLAEGLTEYRAGRYADAVERLQRGSPTGSDRHWDAGVFSVLAMAHRRLGHAREAEAALDAARKIVADEMRDPTRSANWLDSLQGMILCREAEQLFKNDSGVDEGR